MVEWFRKLVVSGERQTVGMVWLTLRVRFSQGAASYTSYVKDSLHGVYDVPNRIFVMQIAKVLIWAEQFIFIYYQCEKKLTKTVRPGATF